MLKRLYAPLGHISHFHVHFPYNAVSERVGFQNGKFVVDVLEIAISHIGHDGGGIIIGTAFLDEHSARSLVYSR